MGVRFCSIAEPNRTIGVRLGSIGFLFGFVPLDRLGEGCEQFFWSVGR